MTLFGVVQVGRLALREDDGLEFSLAEEGQQATFSISGQESVDRIGYELTKKRVDDIFGLNGRMVPVSFSHKSELDGFYRVSSATGSVRKWVEQNANVVPWQLQLERVGYTSEMSIESRLSGPITRVNDHSATGKRWHAPAGSHYAYAAGSTAPLNLTRASSDGSIIVYHTLGAAVNPRWGSTPTNYQIGRVRFLDNAQAERVGTQMQLTATGWTLTNGIVRLQVNGTTGVFEVSAWTGGAWQMKGWELFHSTGPAVTLGVPTAISVLRNDYEVCVVRLIKGLNPGRVYVDFILRRGSRFLEIYVQHQFGTTLKLVRSSSEVSTSSTGFIRATAADGAGNKFVLGSARSFTADTANGGISKAATPTLDAFVGVEVSGAGTGDAGADLLQQYLGSPGELVAGVKY